MANKIEFNVLVNGTEEISKSMSKAAQSLDDFSKVAKNLGRELGQIGQIISVLGASVSGPLVLAFNNAAKSSAEVSEQITRMKNTTDRFQKDIAEALVPVFERFNNVILNLYNAFSSLDQAFKNQLIQGALLTGVFLTLGGILTVIVAKTFSLIASVAELSGKFLLFAAANPIMIAVGVSIAVIVGLMIKFKDVADVVLSTFQALFIFLQNGFLTIKSALEVIIFAIAQNIQNVVSLLAKIPGPTQMAMQMLSNEVQILSNNIRAGINQDLQAIIENANTLGEIFRSGEGSWSIAFDELKTKAQELFTAITDKTAIETSLVSWKDYIDKLKLWWQSGGDYYKKVQSDMVGSLKGALQQAAQLNSSFAIAYKAVAIGEAIMNTAAGVTRAFKDYAWPFSTVVAGIVGAMGAIQIATIASQSFAVGTPEIPKDMVAQVHKGETIIPETFAGAIRSGDLSLSGGGNTGSGINFDFTGATFNGITRDFVEEIFTKASESIANKTLVFRGA